MDQGSVGQDSRTQIPDVADPWIKKLIPNSDEKRDERLGEDEALGSAPPARFWRLAEIILELRLAPYNPWGVSSWVLELFGEAPKRAGGTPSI